MKGHYFNGSNLETFNLMKPIIRNDTSGADVHVSLVNSPKAYNGGRGALSSICTAIPLAVCTLSVGPNAFSIYEFGETISHEIGHILGNIPSSFILI